jgi:Adenylate and Guanylate cyclase catalytic domain
VETLDRTHEIFRAIRFVVKTLAARMESTSAPNRIQVSRATADHLIASGKEHWIIPREDVVHAKGLGALKTFWLQIGTKKANSIASSQEENTTANESSTEPKLDSLTVQHQRNVDWIVDLLLSHIRPMVSKIVVCQSSMVVMTRAAFLTFPIVCTWIDCKAPFIVM